MSVRLVVYGTLMPGESQGGLLAPLLAGAPRPVTLEGWLLLLPEGYPALLVPSLHPQAAALLGPPGVVHGVCCLLGITREAGWEALDAWEDHRPGDPTSLYTRVEVEVEGEVVFIYVWNPLRDIEQLIRRATWARAGRFRGEALYQGEGVG